MIHIVVTGGTGFVGRHVVGVLAERGHRLTVVSRRGGIVGMAEDDRIRSVAFDVHAEGDHLFTATGVPDLLLHLAWPDLSNFNAVSHLERHLPAECAFLRRAVEAGLPRLLVTGTCLEYGHQNGGLTERATADPTTPYGAAKNALRVYLESLGRERPFTLQWVRLFYLHGPGQNPKSLLAQLDAAIERNDEAFKMSRGEQLRDYLPVADAAARLAALAETPDASGVFNCCSGIPISVRTLVERRLADRKHAMRLELGHYPYPDYEPLAFWGDATRLEEVWRKWA